MNHNPARNPCLARTPFRGSLPRKLQSRRFETICDHFDGLRHWFGKIRPCHSFVVLRTLFLRYTFDSGLTVDTLLTIKKYPNRRLYDMASSSYVTLDHIRAMIVRGEDFAVLDSRTSENVTHNVLLQIIGERETQQGSSMLSNKLLTNLIRFYGDSLQGVMAEYLEKSVNSFVNQQHQLREQMQTVIDSNTPQPGDTIKSDARPD